MILRTALSASQALELDELLWTVLWKPLGLDRDVRGKLKAQGRETVIAAEVDGRIKGQLAHGANCVMRAGGSGKPQRPAGFLI